MAKAETPDLSELPPRAERGAERDGPRAGGEEDRGPSGDGEGGAPDSGSPSRRGASSPPHKLGFSYNQDADLIKKKRASLRHAESEPASDGSTPPLNHTDTPTTQVNTQTHNIW